MGTDRESIALARARAKENVQPQLRQARALEQIAETLEALRADLADFKKAILEALDRP